MDAKTLKERQAWTLAQKIDHSLGVIDQFVSHFDGQVYVSFSGGKDSCVMLSLVEMIMPHVPCLFVMTGCESPSVCRFVRQMKRNGHNIEFAKPKKTLKQILQECGFPLVSKQVSHDIHAVRRNPYCMSSRKKLIRSNPHRIPERWMYLLNEPYEVSDRCCYWLKKQPCYAYSRRTGRKAFVGVLASESDNRTASYVSRGGCNSFAEYVGHSATSWPLAIWTDADVWAYIADRHLVLPDVYERGVTRTGCMGCGFGAHLDATSLQVMQREWPRWYAQLMDYRNNGVRYGDALQKTML